MGESLACDTSRRAIPSRGCRSRSHPYTIVRSDPGHPTDCAHDPREIGSAPGSSFLRSPPWLASFPRSAPPRPCRRSRRRSRRRRQTRAPRAVRQAPPPRDALHPVRSARTPPQLIAEPRLPCVHRPTNCRCAVCLHGHTCPAGRRPCSRNRGTPRPASQHRIHRHATTHNHLCQTTHVAAAGRPRILRSTAEQEASCHLPLQRKPPGD